MRTRKPTPPEVDGAGDADRAYARAVRLLAVRARSVAEVRKRLRSAGCDHEPIEAALTRLGEDGYLDDAAFAARWVEWRTGSKPKSRSAIRRELLALGVPKECVDAALSAIDDEVERENAARLALARARQIGDLPVEKKRQRLSTYLRARGYGWDLVRVVLTDILGDDG